MEFLNKSPEIDDFSYHEALDRCYLAMMMLNNHLIEHQVFEFHSNEKNKLEEASEIIMEVYQRLGSAYREPEIDGHAI